MSAKIIVFACLIIAIIAYVYFVVLNNPLPKIPGMSSMPKLPALPSVSQFPKNVGCSSSEGGFCICDAEGKPQNDCTTCTPYNLNSFGGNFAKSVDEGVKGKYKYVAVASLPNSGANQDGFWFGFNALSPNFKQFENAGCNMPCHTDKDRKCGCADAQCPASANTQRAWAVYQNSG